MSPLPWLSHVVDVCVAVRAGLVFPAVDMPRPLQVGVSPWSMSSALMVIDGLQVLAGLFPIAQTREPYSAIQYLAARVPLVSLFDTRLLLIGSALTN